MHVLQLSHEESLTLLYNIPSITTMPVYVHMGDYDKLALHVLLQVKANWMTYQSDIATFWLTTLNRAKRKEVRNSQKWFFALLLFCALNS